MEFLLGWQTSWDRIQAIINRHCVFFHEDVIFIICVDNSIFLGSSDKQLMNVITELQNLNLDIEDQGHPANYAGVNIKHLKDDSIELS